jgi:hypothetical protein
VFSLGLEPFVPMPHTQVIHVHPAAAAKPAVGEACNGCGVCCLAEPCPIGMLVTGRTTGACSALRWDDVEGVYRCGVLTEAVPERFPAMPTALLGLWQAMARRWIGAGKGCDCSLDAAGVDHRAG